MFYVKTGDDVQDSMIKSLASRYDGDMSPVIAVCTEGDTVPTNAERLIVIYSDNTYTMRAFHKECARRFGEDYAPIERPVSVRVLEDVIRKLSCRRNASPSYEAASFYDKNTRTLSKNGKSVTLTEKESELYLVLREAGGKPVTREELRQKLWKDTNGTNAPDVYVSYLRRKLTEVLGEGALINVRGTGYLLKKE